MGELLYQKYIKEERLENGKLVDLSWEIPETFNFAYDVIDLLAEREPDRRALLWVNDLGEVHDFTFRDLKEKSDQAASFLQSLGIGKGDRVLLMLKRHYEYWYCYLALHKLGAICIPATSQLVTHDITYRISAAGVKAVVCASDTDLPRFCEEAQEILQVPLIKVLHQGSREGWYELHAGMDSAPAFRRPEDRTKSSDPMILYFTSGTSGMPKMVLHDFTYPIGLTAMAIYWHKVVPGGLHLSVAETGWGKAAWGKMYGAWLADCAFFIFDCERFHATELLKVVQDYKVTTFCAPPTIYRFMIQEDLSQFDFSHLTHCVTAGEALNPEVFSKFKQATGMSLLEGYGQTELTLTCANLYQDEVRVGSMGKAFPGIPVDLVDDEGKTVPDGVTGELVVRVPRERKLPGMFCGYYKDDEMTDSVWHDGIYHTGDLAWRDEDGYYWYVSRKDDVIKSSGYRIGPFEVESVLMEHPAVVECAVTGVPDPLRGMVVKATILLARGYEGTDELKKELQNFVKSRTAPYKYPRVIEFTDALPKTVNGKIRRAAIRGEQGK